MKNSHSFFISYLKYVVDETQKFVSIQLQVRRKHRRGKSHGKKVSETFDQNWADALACQRQRFLRRGEVACTNWTRKTFYILLALMG